MLKLSEWATQPLANSWGHMLYIVQAPSWGSQQVSPLWQYMQDTVQYQQCSQQNQYVCHFAAHATLG